MAGELSALYPSATPMATAVAAPTVIADPGAHAARPAPSASVKSAQSNEAARTMALVDAATDALRSVRWGEPPAESVADFGSIFPHERLTAEQRADQDTALRALRKAGFGVTQLGAVVQLARVTAQAGYHIVTEDEGNAALSELWGASVDRHLATARSFIDAIAKDWPGVREFLRTNGLGNHPAMIRLAYLSAKRQADAKGPSA